MEPPTKRRSASQNRDCITRDREEAQEVLPERGVLDRVTPTPVSDRPAGSSEAVSGHRCGGPSVRRAWRGVRVTGIDTDFDDIVLNSGQTISLVFLKGSDLDGLFDSEERLLR